VRADDIDDGADALARAVARATGLGTLPMQAPDLAVAELERCVLELGFAGVQIGSHVNDMTLDDARLFPVFERGACERAGERERERGGGRTGRDWVARAPVCAPSPAAALGACVFVHPWDMVGADLMKKYWLPWLVGMPAESSLATCSLIFGGVLERLPALRVLIAHGSGAFLGTIGRVQHGWDVRPDLCAGAWGGRGSVRTEGARSHARTHARSQWTARRRRRPSSAASGSTRCCTTRTCLRWR
jgi:aminocarboxymuconate-semialdehyde decarboxylase